eukprot:m.179789 g.179789  ORF g.179789 m.179789 type:complete len:325 (-) comp18000_c0_seq7:1381-2355(-)
MDGDGAEWAGSGSLLPSSVMAVAALLAAAVTLTCVVYKPARQAAGRAAFRVAYFAYASTPLGLYIHQLMLMQSADKAKVQTKATSLGQDNFAYLIIDDKSHTAAVVDPADADAVKTALIAHKAKLTAILTTHRHADHSGGNHALLKAFPSTPVYGGLGVPGLTEAVGQGDVITVGRLQFQVMSCPGHTVESVVFVLSAPSRVPSVFCGDVLFVGGSGKFFEGAPAVMFDSLAKLAVLNPATLVWPGHEYALGNLRFAATIEPQNERVHAQLRRAYDAAKHNTAFVPSTVAEELVSNLFLKASAEPSSDAAIAELGRLRKLKDAF